MSWTTIALTDALEALDNDDPVLAVRHLRFALVSANEEAPRSVPNIMRAMDRATHAAALTEELP